MSSTRSCECEHAAHDTGIAPRTPKGNVGHAYGKHFALNMMTPIRTPFGLFTVCQRCASDCWSDRAAAVGVRA